MMDISICARNCKYMDTCACKRLHIHKNIYTYQRGLPTHVHTCIYMYKNENQESYMPSCLKKPRCRDLRFHVNYRHCGLMFQHSLVSKKSTSAHMSPGTCERGTSKALWGTASAGRPAEWRKLAFIFHNHVAFGDLYCCICITCVYMLICIYLYSYVYV